MRREEFMTELASLLQDISAEERMEAMQYYNDYFDDAGKDEEEKIIKELGSPAKVAAEVKAGLKSQSGDTGEYRETGYTDTRFENRESPANRNQNVNGSNSQQYSYGEGDAAYTATSVSTERKPWTNKPLKIVLIILVILAAIPVLGPIAVGIISAIFGILIAIVAVFGALVIASVAVAISGLAVIIAGLVAFISNLAAGFLVTGVGIILTVLGIVATIASIRLCVVVFPGIIRGIVWLGRKIFRKGKAVL